MTDHTEMAPMLITGEKPAVVLNAFDPDQISLSQSRSHKPVDMVTLGRTQVEQLRDLLGRWLEKSDPKPKFTHTLDLCFNIGSDFPADKVPVELILARLQQRVDYLKDNPAEIREACGHVDTVDNQD